MSSPSKSPRDSGMEAHQEEEEDHEEVAKVAEKWMERERLNEPNEDGSETGAYWKVLMFCFSCGRV